MAFTYNTYTHKSSNNDNRELDFSSDSIQSVPEIVIAVFPYKKRATYHYLGPNTNLNDISETDSPQLIDNICTALSVSENKKQHIGSLQASFKGDKDLAFLFAPGDWIMAWFVNSAEHAQTIRKNLSSVNTINPCNTFNSGLKFVGKIATIQKHFNVNTSTGHIQSGYSITANSFTEFDAHVYYDISLSFNTTLSDVQLQKFFGNLKGLDAFSALTNAQTAIPKFIGCILGSGPAKVSVQAAEGDPEIPISPNRAFTVPIAVGQTLGYATNKGTQKTLLTYDAILSGIYGIQKYDNSGFLPSNLSIVSSDQKQFFCKNPLTGEFTPQTPSYNDVPLWGVLNNYLVPAVNELYTCLRIDANNLIVPHIIARQQPFSTQKIAQKFASNSSKTVTPYHSLPRWKIELSQILTYNVTKSDALRCNWVRLVPQAVYKNKFDDAVKNSRIPQADISDIQVNGLRSWSPTLNVKSISENGASTEVDFWNELTADWMIDGHLKYTGQITVKGIQEPICVGDNLEFDNLLFHIQSVTHNFTINSFSGQKTFDTILLVSDGVPVNSSELLPDIESKTHSDNLPPNINFIANEPGQDPALSGVDNIVGDLKNRIS